VSSTGERNSSDLMASLWGCKALLHKSAELVIPQTQTELRHGHRHGHRRAQACEAIEDSGTDLQFGDLAVEVTCHDAFAKQLEATHFGLDKAAPMIASPLFPDLPAKPARGRQDSIAGFGARTLVLPWLGVFASRDDRLRPMLRNRFVTAFGVVGR